MTRWRTAQTDTTTTPEPVDTPTRDPGRRHLWRSRWAAVGAAVAVTLGGGAVHFASADSSDPSDIIAITPVRILDTRDGVDLGLAGPFVSAVGQDLKVTGSVPTPTGAQTVVPDGATGVLLNVTVVLPSADGFISVRPSGTPGAPETSSLNFEAGDITPNAVFVALPTSGGSAGSIEITYDAFGTAGPTSDVLVDVTGYTTAAPDVYTKAEADATFLTEVDAYTKAEADAAFGSLFAVVDHEGVLRRGTAGVTAAAIPAPPGRYSVSFPVDISQCAFQATLGLWTSSFATAPSTTGIVSVRSVSGDPTSVQVFTRSEAGVDADRPFHLTVHC